MGMREVLICALAGIGLFGCTNNSDLRVEPNRKGLDKYISENNGRMLPLYSDGRSPVLLSIFIDGGRINHCMAGRNGEVVDSQTCRKEQPYNYGFGAALGTLEHEFGPCYGGRSKDMLGTPLVLAICIAASPFSGTNTVGEQKPYSIAAGQAFYFFQMEGNAIIFSLEPMSDEPAVKVAAVSRTRAKGEQSAAADAAAVVVADSAATLPDDEVAPSFNARTVSSEATTASVAERAKVLTESARQEIEKTRHHADADIARHSSHPSSVDANPIVKQLPEYVVSVSSVDAKYSERVEKECPWGALGEPCHQKIREELCAGKWSANPEPGQNECKR